MEKPLQVITEELQGKTYSLRFHAPDSNSYYSKIAELVDALLRHYRDESHLLSEMRKLSKSRRHLRNLARDAAGSADGRLIVTLRQELADYTPGVRSHLRELRAFERWDRTLTTSEEQYHLYMLEIELVNRLYAGQFRACTQKLAFLPHCLRDLTADCRAAERDLDYICKGCTEECKVNHASKLLRRHGVKPYIWMTADLRALFQKVRKEGNSLGVLGIACIPELVRGMRMCLKYEVPVVGVPLDANRCARWWGQLYWNSVNLTKLEGLFTDEVHSLDEHHVPL